MEFAAVKVVHPEIPGIRAIWIKRTKNSILKRSITAAPRNAPKGRLCSTAHDAAALIMTQLRKPPKTMTQNRNDQPRSALDRKQQSKNTGKKKCANTKSNSGDLDSARKERKKEEKKGKKTLERNGKQKFLDRNNNPKKREETGQNKKRSEATVDRNHCISGESDSPNAVCSAARVHGRYDDSATTHPWSDLSRSRPRPRRTASEQSFVPGASPFLGQAEWSPERHSARRALSRPFACFFPRPPTDCRSTESSYR